MLRFAFIFSYRPCDVHAGGRQMEDFEEWDALHHYVTSTRQGGKLATKMMLKGLSIGSEPYAPFYVTGMYPSAREGRTLVEQIVEWSADRYYAFHHEDGTPRTFPIFSIGCAVDSCGVGAGASAYNMTPHQLAVDADVVYLGLDTPGFRFVTPYYHELPFISYMDWDHVGRNDRKVLDNARHHLVWGIYEDPNTNELIFDRASFDALRRLKERIADECFLDKVTNINPFQDQKSDAANVMLSERTTVALLENSDLPNAKATFLQIEAGRLAQQPIRDPNFGTPFDSHRAIWARMFLFALQKQIASTIVKNYKQKLPVHLQLEHLTTTDETFRTHELMSCAATCHLLACKRHGELIPWQKKVTPRNIPHPPKPHNAARRTCHPPVVPPQMSMQAPMRKYSDTRGCEGRFGGYRVNINASTNSVNFTFKSAITKEAANFRLEEAKQATLPLGMVWEPPKIKASTYKTVAAPGELSGDWVAFIAKADAMSYDELVAYLIRDMNEALRAAQHLIERHAPSEIALLRKHNPEVTWRSFCSYTSLVDGKLTRAFRLACCTRIWRILFRVVRGRRPSRASSSLQVTWPVRLGVRPEKPTVFKLRIDQDVAKRRKTAEKRAKELRKLRELDLPKWSTRQARNDCQSASSLVESPAIAQAQEILSAALDSDGFGDSSEHTASASAWLETRQSRWRSIDAFLKARTSFSSTTADVGEEPSSTAESSSTAGSKRADNGNVYVIRAGGKVEINKGLAALRNELEFPNAGRRARYILRKLPWRPYQSRSPSKQILCAALRWRELLFGRQVA